MDVMKKYEEFVDSRLSNPSSNIDNLLERINDLCDNGFDVPRMLTAEAGLSNEASEFGEYVKKIVFQGKEYDDDEVRQKMIKELGDMMFYMMVACKALDVSFEDVIQGNVDKLTARYPDGHFDIARSEKRKEGDD